ncbi:MAG: hypothetical protein J0M18_12375 [Ignavibacteria bacterium]|nr:hypothetical protein [Ignavibacteria bacterium]
MNKTNLGFTAGVSVPTDFEIFTKDHKGGFNLTAFAESNFTRYLTLGMSGSLSNYPYRGIYTAGPHIYISGGYYFKIQDNLLKDGKVQLFAKGGVGIFKGMEKFEIEARRLTLSGFSFLAGAGVNYLVTEGNKIFFETDYEIYVKSLSSFQFKLGLSFCLNRDL